MDSRKPGVWVTLRMSRSWSDMYSSMFWATAREIRSKCCCCCSTTILVYAS